MDKKNKENSMKKFTIISLLAAAILFSANCKTEKVSKAECEPVVNQMFENLTKSVTPEEAEKITALKGQLITGVIKECTSGKYSLECLKNATNIAALQTCKN